MAFNISYLYEIIDKASGPLGKIARKQKKLGAEAVNTGNKVAKAAKKQEKSLSGLGGALSGVAGVAAAAFAVALPIRDAIKFESAMSDVAKVVEFKEPDGLKKMAASIKKMSAELPISQEGLAAIVAQGGQLGVPTKALGKFAEMAAKMGIAFDIAPDAAAESMAKLSNIFGVPIQEMRSIGDAINFVSNNAAASASDIVTALRSGAGAGARAMGLTAEQAIALSTQFIAQGLSASEAGTRVQILSRNLLNAKKTTKLLGAGFSKLVKQSPQKAIEKLLEAVAAGKIPQQKLNELFGETVNDFTLLAKSGEDYKQILGLVADKTKFAGSMQKEFEARAATTGNQLILLRNRLKNASINIGSVFLPIVSKAAGVLGGMSDKIADFAEKNPLVIKAVGAFSVAMVGLKTAFLAARMAMVAVNIAMAANPIGLIVVAVAGLIAVAIALADEYDVVGDVFRDVGDVFAGFGDSLAPLGDVIGSFFGDGAGAVEIFAKAVRIAFTPLVTMIDLVKRLAAADFTSLSSIGDAFSGAASTAVSFFSNANGVSPNIQAPGAQEVTGRLGVDISLAGNREAVESVRARQIGNGNLGLNMAVAQ